MLENILLDRTRRLRTFWRFLIYGFGFVSIMLGVNIVVGLGFAAYLFASSDAGHHLDFEEISQQLDEATPILTAIMIPFLTVLLTLLTVVCRRYLDRRTVASLGMSWPGRGPAVETLLGTSLGVALIFSATLCLWMIGEFQVVGWSASIMTWIMIPTLVLAAFEEEIVVRGYLLQNLLDIRRPIFGVIFTSIVFWLIHSLNPHVWKSPWIGINLFGAGVVLALAYLVSGNLWFPTALHFGWNFAQGVVLRLPVSGVKTPGIIAIERMEKLPEWVSGGDFGLEGSVFVTLAEIFLAIAFGLALWFRTRTMSDGYRDCAALAASPEGLEKPGQAQF